MDDTTFSVRLKQTPSQEAQEEDDYDDDLRLSDWVKRENENKQTRKKRKKHQNRNRSNESISTVSSIRSIF